MNKEKQIGFTGSIIIFFILLFVYSKWGPSLPISVLTQTKGEPLIVTETGKVAAVPDIAKITLGIEEQGESLKTVQNSINLKSNKLTSELKKLEVDEKDIKTLSYNVYPEYNYDIRPYRLSGYRVSTTYEVKIKDFEKVNDALVVATDSGSNIVGNISFERVVSVAKTKLSGLLAKDLRAGIKLIVGTCVSLGILIDNKETEKKIKPYVNEIKLNYPIKIDEHYVTFEDFVKMLLREEENLAKQIFIKHRLFYNADIYYQLLKEAYKDGFRP